MEEQKEEGKNEEGADGPPAVPEKKVTLDDKLKVYLYTKDSTNVHEVGAPPPPPVPTASIPQSDLEKIVQETLKMVDFYDKKCCEQKVANQKLAFMLNNVMESLRVYAEHTERIRRFLVSNEMQQSQWYIRYWRELPVYGDYVESLEDSEEKIEVNDVPVPIAKNVLRNFSQDVVDTMYAGGVQVKAQKTLGKSVFEKVANRRRFARDLEEASPSWFYLLNRVGENQTAIRDRLFDVAAFVSFLKTGVKRGLLKYHIDNTSE
ncbi:hypothetical protein J6590_069123 [Homalodisca vitripennis]|nr:hypothetical protein J6590_069123 [Homalodisca vitripennis]